MSGSESLKPMDLHKDHAKMVIKYMLRVSGGFDVVIGFPLQSGSVNFFEAVTFLADEDIREMAKRLDSL